MKRIANIAWVIVLIAAACSVAFAADTLETVKNRGVLIAGVKDSTKPFGYFDEKTRQIIGYDVDFVAAIARKLGVKLDLRPVTSASRIPKLIKGDVDIIAATMTKTAERAKIIDFSHTYFLTVQKFLAKKATIRSLADLDGKRIGTAKSSTSEKNIKNALPKATIVSYDDYQQAFLALQQGKVFAVATDESILAAIQAEAPNKDQFEISNIHISDEPYGLGMRKGHKNFVDFVNKTLLEMEKNGEAKKIFDKWFGPSSPAPMARTFRIIADK